MRATLDLDRQLLEKAMEALGASSFTEAIEPFPDLLVAATAVWMDVALLTWDARYAQASHPASRS